MHTFLVKKYRSDLEPSLTVTLISVCWGSAYWGEHHWRNRWRQNRKTSNLVMSAQVKVFLWVRIFYLNLDIKILIQGNNLWLDMNTSNILSSCPLSDPDHGALVLQKWKLSLCCHCNHHCGAFLNCHIFLYCAGSHRYPVLGWSLSFWRSAVSSSIVSVSWAWAGACSGSIIWRRERSMAWPCSTSWARFSSRGLFNWVISLFQEWSFPWSCLGSSQGPILGSFRGSW